MSCSLFYFFYSFGSLFTLAIGGGVEIQNILSEILFYSRLRVTSIFKFKVLSHSVEIVTDCHRRINMRLSQRVCNMCTMRAYVSSFSKITLLLETVNDFCSRNFDDKRSSLIASLFSFYLKTM